MRRDIIEKITASLVVTLTTVLSFGIILVFANLIFEWDIFTPFVEKILYFIAASSFIIILASAMVNITINLSRLSFFSEVIAQKLLGEKK